jgi:hypothetical protein
MLKEDSVCCQYAAMAAAAVSAKETWNMLGFD